MCTRLLTGQAMNNEICVKTEYRRFSEQTWNCFSEGLHDAACMTGNAPDKFSQHDPFIKQHDTGVEKC